MPYYNAGDYYMAGDNYAAGGLFKSIGKFIGGAARTLIGATPVGSVVNSLLPARSQQLGRPLVPVPGIRGIGQRIVPGGETGYMPAPRRRINPLNIKALRRAMRRAKGFERQARRVGTFFNPGKSYRLKGRRPRKRS